MCGIYGFINQKEEKDNWDTILAEMGDVLEHRGPDAVGSWTDPSNQVNLGHRRLSIIDLTDAGAQPMESLGGRYVIIFNGEIYNYEEIRMEIIKNNNISFRGHSDTEVILAGFETWGIIETINKLKGMFAIVLYDTTEKKIYLIRDRIGEKPLYYGEINDSFVFGSELKVFSKYPGFKKEIDREALKLYFQYSYIPSPYSIYKNIYKLDPGSVLVYNLIDGTISKSCYWELNKMETTESDDTIEEDVIEKLNSLLTNSIKKEMLAADVPIGAFLSGGVDSSTVAAIMQNLSSQPINTFSIGFKEDKFNEAEYAKKVANHLGTNHTELYLSSEDAINIIPDMPKYFDEPFADSSQIPTFLVSKLAKQHVTVALSGDGGDELFGGYARYQVMEKFESVISKFPIFTRRKGSHFINYVKNSSLSQVFNVFPSKIVDHTYRGGELLMFDNANERYNYFISSWKSNENLVLNQNNKYSGFIESKKSREFYEKSGFLKWMMYTDTKMYLPDDILVKLDRSSMANSLESRVPLLDYEIVEFAHNLPLKYKVKEKQSKWILKQVMYKYLPKELMDRPKKGFSVPIANWLRGPLKEWADDLLAEEKLIEQGYLDSQVIIKRWEEHKNGSRDWHAQLWSVLMFQSWLKENI
ncbi:asparagine synthase (glutamine-hydrolyzing) [Planomicrobium okeanokoites]|uniref:asparagine synthase (glutamine-hydrolyzing) n=1 Tax=Planomicrobium okeanokoites TaxID=244 RepID=UPI0030FACAD1